jgi:multidrug transporter EmrE-like cation transporter
LPWIFLFAAILFEVPGITSMKLSRGLSEPVASLAVLVFYVCSARAFSDQNASYPAVAK